MGINAFLDEYAEERKPQPKATVPTLDTNDATHALKLAALAERGIGGEKVNA